MPAASRRTRNLRNGAIAVFLLGAIQSLLLSENVGSSPALHWGIGIPLVVLLVGFATGYIVSRRNDGHELSGHTTA